MSSTDRKSSNTYDFIRLFAAVAVLGQHATHHLDAPILWHTAGDPWYFYAGLHTFFIISGYFVFRSADRLLDRRPEGGWVRTYASNRGLRIAPALWIYGVISVVTVVAVGAATWAQIASPQGAVWVGTMAVLLPAFSPGFLDSFGAGHVNGSLPTIAVEVTFYVCVPVFVLLARKLGRRRFAVGFLIVAGLVSFATLQMDGSLGSLLYVTYIPHLWWFALGVAVYLWGLDNLRLDGRLAILALAGYIALILLGPHVREVPLVLARGVILAYLVFYIGERGPRVLNRFVEKFGDLSYGTYIWHMLFVNLFLWWGLESSLPAHSLVPAILVLSLVAAFLSWHLVEKPVLRLKRASTRSDSVASATGAGPDTSGGLDGIQDAEIKA